MQLLTLMSFDPQISVSRGDDRGHFNTVLFGAITQLFLAKWHLVLWSGFSRVRECDRRTVMDRR